MKKNAILTFILLALFISCNNSNAKKQDAVSEENKEEKPSIIGVWERTSFYNYDEDGSISDSIASSDSNRHIKIFTPTKVMWCRTVESDSSEWFGYGHYTLTDSLLTEELEYGSKEMSKYINRDPKFNFHYSLEEDKFSQIQYDAEGHPLFSENYIRIE